MKIFVTGGSGFVGGHLIEALARAGHETLALARSDHAAAVVRGYGATPVRGALGEVSAALIGGAEAVIHAAAVTEEWGTRAEFWSGNVTGTANLLAAARDAGVRRFVYVGTEAALFVGRDLVGVDEEAPYPARHHYLYSETKAEAERLVLAAAAEGFATVSIRPRLVWGPRDATVLPTILRMAAAGSYAWIDGGAARTSTTHVANAVHALLLALTKGESGRALLRRRRRRADRARLPHGAGGHAGPGPRDAEHAQRGRATGGAARRGGVAALRRPSRAAADTVRRRHALVERHRRHLPGPARARVRAGDHGRRRPRAPARRGPRPRDGVTGTESHRRPHAFLRNGAMPAAPLDVAVIGLGTAGGAAALFLARGGHRVTLFERVPEPGAVGAGIMLQPTGQAVLARLGLLDRVLARAARVDRLRAETTRGRVLFDLAYADLGGPALGFGLHRGVLFETLYAAVRAAPVCLELGVGIEAIGPCRGGRRVLTDAAGGERGPFDLVVIADGARSHLFAADGPRKRVGHYPWGALWFVGQDPGLTAGAVLRQVLRGTQRMIGLLPTGLGPGAGAGPRGCLFYSLPVAGFASWHHGFEAWKTDVRALAPRAAPVLDQIERPDQVLFAAYHDVVMRRWHGEGIVHVGDAAHAMSPQLGQGANLALTDATVLGDCLEETASPAAALAEYTRRRRQHLGFYQFASRWLTPLFQSNLGVLGWARDAFMPLAARLPPVRRLMVRTMTGTVTGLLRAPLVLPAGAQREAPQLTEG